MSQPRILIVDDEPMIRMALRILLRVNGYEPIEAADAATGLRICREQDPAIVLLDLMMPEMTGFDMLRTLDFEYIARTPIIILSAVGDAAQEEQAYALGAKALVVKPFRNQTLLNALQYFLGETDTLCKEVRLPPH